MLLERKDIRTAAGDNESLTPLPLALSQGHDGIARAILEWDNTNSYTAGRSGWTPLPPSVGNRDDCGRDAIPRQ